MTTCVTRNISAPQSNMFPKLSREVIVLDEDGNLIGKMHFKEARDLASQKGLDLIEVNKQGETSVCKIMDQGKWLYEQKKKLKQKKATVHQLKEMKFGMRIEKHDEDTKVRHIKELLEKGHDIRIIIEMRGRERSHPDLAEVKLNGILTELQGLIRPESIRKTPANLSLVVHPIKG